MARVVTVLLIAGLITLSSLAAQSPVNQVILQPAPDIPGVIKAGTLPEIVVRGLRAADDPIWLPNIGLVFSESPNNRVVKLGEDDQVTTFIGELHGPLGMTLDAEGRLISLQTQAGFAGPRVIYAWPTTSRGQTACS